jgi:predicted ribosome quality control (RQC) complex YloA/Tae2 family protein
MYYSHLVHIVDYLNEKSFKTLTKIVRTDDNILELTLDRDFYLCLDLKKSESSIYLERIAGFGKSYQAAFDVILQKKFSRTTIEKFEIVNDDKVMRMWVLSRGAYKQERLAIDFEFTGKYTNAIIIDESFTIVEALRHIDARNSSRVVRPGERLEMVPKASFAFKEYPLEDVEAYLYEVFEKRHHNMLSQLKSVKLGQLNKQLKKLEKQRQSLDTSEKLEKKAERLRYKGEVVLANLHLIKPYEKVLKLYDFEGEEVTVELTRDYPQVSMISQDLFTQAKKAKQKAKFLYIEEENLDQRLSFVRQLISLVNHAETKEEIDLLVPKQKKQGKKEIQHAYEVFWVDNYKLLLGRNAKGNQALLEACKANDLWFHFKDRSSAHVAIISDKQKIPPQVIQKAARLCVDFTIEVPGRYSIDYTKRKEVQVQDGSSVLYNKYETIIIDTTKEVVT